MKMCYKQETGQREKDTMLFADYLLEGLKRPFGMTVIE